MRSTLLTALTALLIVAPAADAATTSQANAKARKAADAYTDKNYGISGGTAAWTAKCGKTSGAWKCTLRFNGGQCSGSLKLSANLSKSYAIKIACGE